MQAKSQPPENSALFIATIVATGSTAINAAIPDAAHIESSFGLDAGTGARIVGTFVAGYAIGHILVGLLAQGMSQKSLLLTGLSGFIACSLSIGVAAEPEVVSWIRAGQGLFASTCPIIGRALVRQMGTTRRAAKKMSGASAIFTWAPVFVPLIAGAISEKFGWRGVYFALATYGGIGLVWVLSTPAHRFATAGDRLKLSRRLRNFAELCKNPVSRAGLVSGSLAFAGFFSFLAVVPNLRSDWTAAPISLATAVALFAAGYALGAILSRISLNHVDELTVLIASLAVMAIVGLAQGTIALASSNVDVLIGLAFVYAAAAGAAMPNATLLTMRGSIDLTPFALSFLGMSKMALAALITPLITFSTDSAGACMTLVMSVAAIGGLVVILPIRRLIGS